MRRLLPVLLALAALSAVLAVPAFGATKTVNLRAASFAPGNVTIKKNSSVKFRWRTGFHDVVKRSGPRFRNIGARRGGSVTRKFTRKGTYRLRCTIHPGMNLRVRVR